MKKFYVFLLTIIATSVIAGLYGILHDQFTYTICNEYFTRFKFYQFGLAEGTGAEAILPHPRVAVACVGFMATWWTGLLIGIAQALTGLTHPDAKTMSIAVTKAIFITLIITPIVGLIGLVYGWFFLSNVATNWPYPEGLVHKKTFIAVGSMHNFSYLGGAIGLFAGVGYQLYIAATNRRKRFKDRPDKNDI